MNLLKERVKKYKNRIKKLNTPSFVWFNDIFEQRIKAFKSLKNFSHIFYSLKANNSISVVKSIIRAGMGFDVASAEEIKHVLQCGGSVDEISFSSPTKIKEDIKYAVNVGVNMFAFDSVEEYKKLIRLISRKSRLFVRVKAVGTNGAIFNLSQKFGMPVNYLMKNISHGILDINKIRGIAFHVGSQCTEIEKWITTLHEIGILIDRLRASNGVIEFVNIGGGIPAEYDDAVKTTEYINKLLYILKQFKDKYGVDIYIEPGRSMVADSEILVTSIINIKKWSNPPWIIIDASVFSGLMEYLEHFRYPVEVLGKNKSNELCKYKVGGFTCDGYDVLYDAILLPKINIGDKLIIYSTGAYTKSYSLFHLKKWPRVVNFT